MIVFLGILIGFVIVPVLGTLWETLLWWYIWNKQSYQAAAAQSDWKKSIVFLTGISDYAAVNLQPSQIDFLHELGERYPIDLMVTEPFPYERCTADKFAAFDIWRHLGFKEPPLWVISLHNFWQTLLAIWFEKAYGTAVARCIINRIGLPRSQHNSTLVFICGSGGAAYALAAAPQLRKLLQVRLMIVSYGGVFGSAQGFDSVANFCQLVGEKDNWAKLGEVVFPGRWLPMGYLAQARKEKRFSVHYTGDHEHFGAKGYLSDRSPKPQEKTYRELTLDTVTKLSIWEETMDSEFPNPQSPIPSIN